MGFVKDVDHGEAGCAQALPLGYWARVVRIAHMLDPRMALAGDNELARADAICARWPRGGPAPADVREADALARARRLREATYHPDTGRTIFAPLRLSFMVPMNLTVDTAMILAATRANPAWSVLAQAANQTYNAFHFYANRNGTHTDSAAQRVAAYALATASSVTAAVSIQSLGPPGSIARAIAPWTAVCVANALNLPTVRASEWLAGVEVRDADDGAPCGLSRVCGAYAVGVCVVSRVTAATPTLVVPPLVLRAIEARRGAPLPQAARLPLLLGLIGANMCCGVPLVFGLFAQSSTLPGAWCEATVRRPDGRRPVEVTFNRGL
ncbi:hypothetical protein KFE25_010047 [Diacronema lutheri]|uniref:Uncharacterized protein n=1 Tax=Diacronema lutheri TaxID=2081491 RepID=A0A8J6C9L3_DIALT|nr:hypothetical protein KFE25_010047 [Diacronema lutheri]